MGDESVKEFLDRIRQEGRSSPAGMYWDDFYNLLRRRAEAVGVAKPPVPLILAAAGESDSSKHRRLADQLAWAEANGVLPEALTFLAALSAEKWNHSSAEDWDRSSYWS